MRRAATFLMLLTALGAPAPALAQSAGDEQYSDPFGPEEPQQQEEQPQAPAEPQAPEPVEPAPSSEPASDADGVAAAPAQSSEPSLPVTGLPVLSVFLIGAGLLAAGAVVRRRL
jgi:hypothetical protein